MTATIIFLVILGLLSLFQIALIFGAPFGHFAWGGQHRVLPAKLRIGSIVSLVIYAGFALIIISKSGLQQIIPSGSFLDITTWILFAYLALGVFMNALSRSKPERYVMTPTALVLACCALVVALS